jgi:hypothetical protein
MSEQGTHTCHYVSRLLTTPWEGAQRFLRYYDFDTNEFELRSSRSLFAADDINSATAERWLHRVVENPLGRIRHRIANGDLEPLEKNWSCYRAAVLVVLLQGGRVSTIVDEDARRHLDVLASMPENELNGLVNEAMRRFDLRVVHTVWNPDETGFAPLYMPSTGLFPLLVRDRGCLSGHSYGFGIPISLTCALVVTPAEQHGRLELSRTRAMLWWSSIGTSNARRVVVMPGLYEQQGEARSRELLLSLRRTTTCCSRSAKTSASWSTARSVYQESKLVEMRPGGSLRGGSEGHMSKRWPQTSSPSGP